MRTLKILYIIAISICAIELLVFLISPFGGPLGILGSIKHGMFTAQSGDQIISVNEVYYPGNSAASNLELLNQICTAGYFLSLLGACSSLFFYKKDKRKKYKIGIVLFAASLVFSVLGGAIWRFLVHAYLF